jgi:hypothetical protein
MLTARGACLHTVGTVALATAGSTSYVCMEHQIPNYGHDWVVYCPCTYVRLFFLQGCSDVCWVGGVLHRNNAAERVHGVCGCVVV